MVETINWMHKYRKLVDSCDDLVIRESWLLDGLLAATSMIYGSENKFFNYGSFKKELAFEKKKFGFHLHITEFAEMHKREGNYQAYENIFNIVAKAKNFPNIDNLHIEHDIVIEKIISEMEKLTEFKDSAPKNFLKYHSRSVNWMFQSYDSVLTNFFGELYKKINEKNQELSN